LKGKRNTGEEKVEKENKEERKGVILVHGKYFGLVDVENLKKHLDQNCCHDCWLYLEEPPVERVEQELEKDHRIQIRVTKNPKKVAKAYMDELKQKGVAVELKRLEQVSDRSMTRGGC